jgi:hypothetical protein
LVFQETEDSASKATGPLSERIKSMPNGLKERLTTNNVSDVGSEEEREERGGSETNSLDSEPARESKTPTASPHRKKKGGPTKKGKGKKSSAELEEDRRKINNVPSASPLAAIAGLSPQETKIASPPSSECVSSEGKEALKKSVSPGESTTVCDLKESSPPLAAETSSDTSEKSAAAAVMRAGGRPAALDAGLGKMSGVSAAAAVASPAPGPPPEDRPSAPVQHSVFKSFFSTDLSIDDIDRQIEAKRMEWVCFIVL